MTEGARPLTRRPERAEDEPFRRALFHETFGEMFAGLDEALRDLVLSQQFAAQGSGYRATYPSARFDIVERDGVAVGRIVTAKMPDTLILVDIAIAAAWRGRGFGTRLIRGIGGEAAAEGLRVILRVASHNRGARRLYERLGFVAVAADATGQVAIDVAMEWRPPFPPGADRDRP